MRQGSLKLPLGHCGLKVEAPEAQSLTWKKNSRIWTKTNCQPPVGGGWVGREVRGLGGGVKRGKVEGERSLEVGMRELKSMGDTLKFKISLKSMKSQELKKLL